MSDPRNVSLFDVDNVTEFGPVRDMVVTPVSSADVDEFCRRWHYTTHKGTALHNWGLWDGFTLVGVVAYNHPALQAANSVLGDEYGPLVFHMGRLVCADDAPRNVESRLIAESLKRLNAKTGARAVLTYAATDEGHLGYVYQATNAIYAGTTAPISYFRDTEGRRKARRMSSSDGGHTIRLDHPKYKGWTEHQGQPKHRYVYLLGNKTERKEAMRLLRYTPQPYPKAAS